MIDTTHQPRAIWLHIEDDGSISTLEQDGSVIANGLSWRDMNCHIGTLASLALRKPVDCLP
jgi:hypothetical protein